MRKINKEDFKLYEDRASKNSQYFCGCCDREVSSSDCCEDGYTDCCNEPTIDKNNFLKYGKIISIDNFLKTISVHSNQYYMYERRERPFNHILVTPTKQFGCEYPIMIDVNQNIDYIIRDINNELKKEDVK